MAKSTYALTLCMVCLFLFMSQRSKAGEVVVFPDPNLDAAVREAINKPTGDILDTDLVGVGFTSLYAGFRDISDLTGLEHCTDLTTLQLYGGEIADLTPLAGLSSLTSLSLGSNQIADLGPLAGLTNLEGLSLGDNQIVDAAPLAGLTSLGSLDLSFNQIVNLAPLASLTSLTKLDLLDNQITDVAPLVANAGLAAGDLVQLGGNPLSEDALCVQIPQLQWGGVVLGYGGTCGIEGEGEGEGDCTLFETLEVEGNAVALERASRDFSRSWLRLP